MYYYIIGNECWLSNSNEWVSVRLMFHKFKGISFPWVGHWFLVRWGPGSAVAGSCWCRPCSTPMLFAFGVSNLLLSYLACRLVWFTHSEMSTRKSGHAHLKRLEWKHNKVHTKEHWLVNCLTGMERWHRHTPIAFPGLSGTWCEGYQTYCPASVPTLLF